MYAIRSYYASRRARQALHAHQGAVAVRLPDLDDRDARVAAGDAHALDQRRHARNNFV